MTFSATQDVHRSNQAWFGRVCERETLDFGIAFYSARYGNYGGANQLREVVLDEVPIEQAWSHADEFYSRQGLRCRRWVPAITQAPEPLEEFLPGRGLGRVELRVMQVTSWAEISGGKGIRVVPARAVREAYADFCGPRADLSLDRLDDPALDMFAAIAAPPEVKQTRVIGRLGFFQIGDIGRVRDLAVREEFKNRGVARALMRHVLAFARRMALRSVCAEVRASDREGITLHRECGFEDLGGMLRFEG